MRKPERLRDNSPRHSFAGQPNSQGLPRHPRLVLELIVKRGIRFRAALQAASCRPTYPQGVALGCYPGAPSARGTWAVSPTQLPAWVERCRRVPQHTARRSEVSLASPDNARVFIRYPASALGECLPARDRLTVGTFTPSVLPVLIVKPVPIPGRSPIGLAPV